MIELPRGVRHKRKKNYDDFQNVDGASSYILESIPSRQLKVNKKNRGIKSLECLISYVVEGESV